MKFLIHSDHPKAGTGYGVQVAYLATRLAADGHEVAVSCKYGHDIGITTWTTPRGDKVRIYPRSSKTVTSVDVVHGHANHFFEGDPKAGWIIPLLDVWGFDNPFFAEFQVASWTPVDHLEVPPDVVRYFQRTGSRCIAMSKHGQAALERRGVQADYIPLTVDTSVFKPTRRLELGGRIVSARELIGVPDSAFVVGVVAMNKGAAFDRKGFSEALHAFAVFHHLHPESVLYLHTDKTGYDGIHLPKLAAAAGVPESAIVFPDPYAHLVGFSSEMMAAAYTAMDVLLAPSHGEGFCVPLIEAQACGTTVIASNATAQPELVGAGWLVDGQATWDPAQDCDAFTPFVYDIVAKLEEAFNAPLFDMQTDAVGFAAQFDTDKVYDELWRPYVEALKPWQPPADKPVMSDVAVVVPAMRVECVDRLVDSFNATNDGTAHLYPVVDPDRDDLIDAYRSLGVTALISDRGKTFAQKANYGYEHTTESFIFLTGEDVDFQPGWIEAARKLSDRYDVIGTNDAEEGRVRNADVAAGRHADHWFTRRSYIDEEGACLEGPGVFCPEAYYHWWVDREVIELARARGVFAPCLESRVVHLHPGFDGNEAAREADPVYMAAVEWSERDRTTFMRRVPLIEQHRRKVAA